MGRPDIPKRYDIIRPLGEGDSARVYLVSDTVLKKELALKLFYRGKKISSSEFKTLVPLVHPNIVRVYDFGFTSKGESYFTEDHIEGRDLISAAGELGDDKKLPAISGIATALSYLHRNGIRHGDLKPSNILVEKNGGIKLLDFGMSNASCEGMFGTPAYMAPEQIEGKIMDERSDLYSLGVVVLELFTGKNPFLGKSVEDTLRRHVNHKITPPVGAPSVVSLLVSKLLEKNPDARLQSADEITALLSEAGVALPPEVLNKKEPDPIVREFIGDVTSQISVVAGFASKDDAALAADLASADLQLTGRGVFRWNAVRGSNVVETLLIQAGIETIPYTENKWQAFESAANLITKLSKDKGLVVMFEEAHLASRYATEFISYLIAKKISGLAVAVTYWLGGKFEITAPGIKGIKSFVPPTKEERITAAISGANEKETLPRLVEAGRKAMAVHDYEGAVIFFERAAGKKSGEVGELLADALTRAGRFSDALKVIEKIQVPSFSASLKKASLFISLGQTDEALSLLKGLKPSNERERDFLKDREFRTLLTLGRYDEIVRDVTKTNDPVLLNTIGLAHYYLGRYIDAADVFKRASANAGASAGASSLNYIGMCHYNAGEANKAKEYFLKAYRKFEQLAHPTGRLSSLINLAAAHHVNGEYRDALKFYNDALELALLVRDSRLEASLRNNLANIFITARMIGEGEKELKKAKFLAEKLKLSIMIGYNFLIEADLFLATGEAGKALAALRRALSVFKKQKAPREICLANINTAKVLAETDPKKALEILRGAEQDASIIGSRDLRAIITVLKAELCFDVGMMDEATASSLEKSLKDKAVSKDMEWEALFVLARFYVRKKDGRSTELLKEARDSLLWLSSQLPLSAREAFLHDPKKAEVFETCEADHKGEDMQTESLKRLLEVNKKLSEEHSPEKVLSFIMDSVIELTGAERGFLVLTGGKGGELNIPIARNVEAEDISKPKFKISRSIAERVIKRGEPLLTTDAQDDSRFKATRSVHALKLRSVMCVPLRYKGESIGAVFIDNRYQSGLFDENDLEVLSAFADQAAVAYVNAKLYAENEKAMEDVAELNKKLESIVARQSVEIETISKDLILKQKDLELKYQYKNIIGRSPSMQALFQLLDRVTDTESNVLITGESGTGKELVAKAIHYNGPRKERPVVMINCAAIPAELLESELFGHKKGSFTGAIADKTGLFEQANFGTIFLDEIGDMPIDMQAKLLRAIQEGEIRRIGTNVNIKVDVRVVAATNKNLVALIAEKKFREDLYYRLNVLPVRLPPLRERREDVTLLIDHFLEKYARGGAIKIIEQAALRYLVNYSWPGNVRELENEIERAVVLSGDVIKETDLSESVRGAMAAGNTLQHRITGSTYEVEHGKGRITGSTYEVEHGKGIRETRMEVERQLIIDALNRSGGNKTEAAKALGLSRFGLYKKMDRYKVK